MCGIGETTKTSTPFHEEASVNAHPLETGEEQRGEHVNHPCLPTKQFRIVSIIHEAANRPFRRRQRIEVRYETGPAILRTRARRIRGHHEIGKRLPRGALAKPSARQTLWLHEMINARFRCVNHLSAGGLDPCEQLHLLIAEKRRTRSDPTETCRKTAVLKDR